MPPKAKFTKEQIIAAGLDIIRVEGLENLSARAIGKRLGSSACPIFTVFENMDEVQAEVKKAAAALYGEYIKEGLKETPAFKGVGMQYIRFAIRDADSRSDKERLTIKSQAPKWMVVVKKDSSKKV